MEVILAFHGLLLFWCSKITYYPLVWFILLYCCARFFSWTYCFLFVV